MNESKKEAASKNEIVIFRSKDNKIHLDVKVDRETVWLSQKQIAGLFNAERSVVTKHLRNIFKIKELDENSVCAKIAHTAEDGKVYQTVVYNLDAIISVGYRVNSTQATQFRIWATHILRQYLIDGYALNDKRLESYTAKLKALQKSIRLIGRVKSRKELDRREALGLLDVVADYSHALGLLDDYDYQRLSIGGTSKDARFKLTYESAIKAVRELKKKFGGSGLFGAEKDQSFKSSVAAIYQTFDGEELYPSIEEKAAHLLYFVVKNHSFVDGNKRIAASVFLWFLEKNALLYKKDGSKRIADNALVALTLMIVESDPVEKSVITTLVVNLINRNN